MKPTRYMTYIALCSLLLAGAGCNEEEIEKQTGSRFTIQIAGEGGASILTRATQAENVTIPLHLFIYKANAADDAQPLFYTTAQLTDATSQLVQCTLPSGTALADSYDIYAVGAEDSEATGLTATTTKGALLGEVQSGIADITSGTKSFMLAGKTAGVTLEESQTVQIVRNVCRLDLALTDESDKAFATVEATLSAPDKTYLFRADMRAKQGEDPATLVNQLPAGTKDTDQTFPVTKETPDAPTFDGSVYFFEKTTDAKAADEASEDDRVKLLLKATRADGSVYRYQAWLNADGSYTTKRNTIYQVNGKLKNGTIEIKTNVLNWEGKVDDPHEIDPIVISPKANSYVLKPGQQIYIPVSQVEDANAFEPTIPTVLDREVLTPYMVWTDVKSATSGKGLAADASVAEIAVKGRGKEALLAVKAGTQHGNSVIAIKGADGNIKWSWHIWVTGYDPEAETGQNTAGGYVFMDRNLGAVTNVASRANGNLGVTGCYYQWGRKDPLPPKGNGTSFVPMYDAEGQTVTLKAAYLGTLPLTVQSPVSYTHTYNFHSKLTLWGDEGPNKFDTPKTAFDPCPAGWRVPRKDAFYDLVSAKELLPKNADNSGSAAKFMGVIPFNDHTRTGVALYEALGYSHLLTSYAAGAGLGSYLRTRNDAAATVELVENIPRYGFGVRCVRDWTKGKLENEVRVLTLGGYQFSSGHPLDVTSRSQVVGSDYIMRMTSVNFGPGKPVNAIFKFYSLAAAVKDDIVDKLVENDIDVLYLPHQVSLNATQAESISTWLAADEKRVLIYSLDAAGLQPLSRLFLGFDHTNEADKNSKVVDSDNPDYKAILVDGPYGAVQGTQFQNLVGCGAIDATKLSEGSGVVPLLAYAEDETKYSLAYDPQRRIIFLGDTDSFGTYYSTSGGSPKDGSLTAGSRGDYPHLMANLWSWIVKTVKGDYQR